MFTLQNTQGFSQSDCDLLNAAVAVLMGRGVTEDAATDFVNNRFYADGENSVESLTANFRTMISDSGFQS